MPRFLRPLTIALAAAVLAIAAAPARAQSVSNVQRGEIERIIKEYLIAHPEVLQEVLNELEKRQADAETEKHRAGVKQYSQALFHSPRQVTIGNRQGDVTLVEFFDYNCGYCKRALSDMLIAEALGLNGTPSYVVGAEVVVGAVGLTALREKVNTARQ